MSSVFMLLNIPFIVLFFNKYAAEKMFSEFSAQTHEKIRYFNFHVQCYVFMMLIDLSYLMD